MMQIEYHAANNTIRTTLITTPMMTFTPLEEDPSFVGDGVFAVEADLLFVGDGAPLEEDPSLVGDGAPL